MKPALDFDTQLESKPLRNENVEVAPAPNDPDVLIAKVTLRYKGVLAVAKKIFNPRPYRRFELAGLTRELYEKLDGKVTVEDLIVQLQAEEKLTFFEARAFVLQYLKGLMQRGLIVVVAPNEDGADSSQ